mmetsp:Transcript_17879/g.32323  ORF Transcript_17879/g.32323 Transcript_17879/m.32323 type:complete len:297 (+) Transcript_17879:72-962(+)|eukprot:CAMPEP_0201932598 /NCGR_PEP_ID=MMETSP0903-20130614/29889_1 /ASSEMBLY_ACC=CAM_ASM_000552 /TAXON_ID=420261 /ORGANISM="Thalassiosira antarctica, Strain CCMP982" /LENGTH=296 /DNA_ID=CAMNT_0048472273 /DNA_START=24 /DNA_END=914 /DNA_ORIENTATION=+
MQRVNAEYANRVTKVLDNAIGSLKNCSDDGAAQFDSCLVDELESLRNEISDTLTLTLVDDESLRSDIRKFECERSTSEEAFVKLRTKLRNMREEREERRVELEDELSELKKVFDEKKISLVKEQDLKDQSELTELESQREIFEKEWKVLEEKRDEVCMQYEGISHCYTIKESKLQDTIASLKMDIQKLSQDHETAISIEYTAIESERTQLEQHKKRRCGLDDHFKRVDVNNAIKKREEEQLRMVCELEEKAMALLDDGAIGLQKLWRGVKERELVAKMKSKKKKKGGKKKGGKKKK